MTQAAATYHQATAYDRHAMQPHALDWLHQPLPYKSYPGLDGVPLPEIQHLFEHDLGAVFAGDTGSAAAPPTLDTVAKICLLAAGLTGRSRQAGGCFYYRSAPSAGALYPDEVYLAALDNAMVPAGIYHLGVHNRFLTRIRTGGFEAKMRAAAPDLPPNCAGVFLVSGIFFRSAWKYRRRAYRYVLLDTGHLAENLRLAINAAGIRGRLHFDFDDRALDALLGLDETREGTLCLVSMTGRGATESIANTPVDNLAPSVLAAGRVSAAEIVYPEIAAIHEAAKTVTAPSQPVQAMIDALGVCLPEGFAPLPEAPEAPAVPTYADAVLQRRSKRNFVRKPLERRQLTYWLDLLCRAAAQDSAMASSASVGFLAGQIEGLAPGFYLLDTAGRKMGRVFCGEMMEKMAAVCLDQTWLKNAAVHFVFLTHLGMLEKQWGPRGYRYAMLTAGRLGHAVYLGATAPGLGACGIGAFYDGEAQRMLRLSQTSAMLYLVAAGTVR